MEREKDENWYRLDIDFLRELLVSVKKKRNGREILYHQGRCEL